MPHAPLRYCAHPGCPVLVPRGRCDAHGGERKAWRANTPPPPRLRGTANQKARAALFQREPLCRPCREAGRVEAATIRDHIVSLAAGGTETPENCQPICRSCHQAKTQAEAARAARLAR